MGSFTVEVEGKRRFSAERILPVEKRCFLLCFFQNEVLEGNLALVLDRIWENRHNRSSR